MADHADDGDNVFVYTGGLAPQHVTHVRIDESVEEIEDHAFKRCEHLVQVETHDGIRRVGRWAFYNCKLLKRINLKSVVQIGEAAFGGCENLTEVECGDKLQTIGNGAFKGCSSLQRLNLPSLITIKSFTFWDCKTLTDIEFSERLEAIETRAFSGCACLEYIAIPLKRGLFLFNAVLERYNQFDRCEHLTTVVLVGGIHKTATSLHMENWRNEMIAEINRINQVLPNTPTNEKTDEIRQWMESVIDKMDHYKAEHYRYIKEGVTLLELALWKAKLDEKEDTLAEDRTKKSKVDGESARKGKRITCGADIVIKNVLPFLQLE